MDDGVAVLLRQAARAVSRAALSDAFGHLSARTSATTALVTPPRPLGHLRTTDLPLQLDLDSEQLVDGAPREAWLHVAVLRARPEVGAVCRAQPPSVAALAAIGITFPALNGHAAMLGVVATHTDSRLVRDLESARQVAETLGDADAIVLRGNGALTVGDDLASAVARMWVLERSASLALQALSAGQPRELPDDERDWWRERAVELLPRIYTYLAHTDPHEEEPQ